MDLTLRIFLFVIAIVFVLTVLKSIKKKDLLIQYSLVWIFLSAAFIIAALFPGLVIYLSDLVGIQTPVNFVSFVGIIGLLFLNLSFAKDMSSMRKLLIKNIQEEAIDKYLEEEDNEN